LPAASVVSPEVIANANPMNRRTNHPENFASNADREYRET
jgi:hypothetical protein